MSEKFTCTCGGEMDLDRSNPLAMMSRKIPRLRCTVCGRAGGYQDWGRNLFPVQKMPESAIPVFAPAPEEDEE